VEATTPEVAASSAVMDTSTSFELCQSSGSGTALR